MAERVNRRDCLRVGGGRSVLCRRTNEHARRGGGQPAEGRDYKIESSKREVMETNERLRAVSAELQEQRVSRSEEGIRANVVFGQASMRCRGAGICKIDVNVSDSWAASAEQEKRSGCCARPAQAYVNVNERGVLELTLIRKSICKKIYTQQFTSNRFRVAESIELPEAMRAALPGAPARIERGYYPCQETAGRIRVSFW